MAAPLSHEQKGVLCQLYRRAFDYQVDRGALGDSAVFEDWRHEQQSAAVGKESLTSCSQDDFAPLMSHGYKLAGEDGLAMKWIVRGQTNPKRVALAKLGEACLEAGVKYPDYPAAICRQRYKCELEALSPNQLWKIFYTVRNRRDSVHRSKVGIPRPRDRAVRSVSQPSTLNHQPAEAA